MNLAEYAKGIVAALGGGATVLLNYGDQFCGSVWPAVVGVLTAVLVVTVPNKNKVR